ncbi:MAG: OmpH family outer membrane protein [Bacteroidales bacterium]|nr:OmpH family outer membrane protein [Bacteroidales bacterium]
MKKLIFLLFITTLSSNWLTAQRIVYVDTEYILSKIPAYQEAIKKLDTYSAKWQKEVESSFQMVENKYKAYQNEKVLLSDEMKKQREQEIIDLEKSAKSLKKKYFGVNGELFKKRQELIKPIQDNIYEAIKQMATEGNYASVIDAVTGKVLYLDLKYDKSDDILKKLGY